MPLTKQELMDRCQKLVDVCESSNGFDIMNLGIMSYLSTSAIFGDITREEALELTNIYLTKIKELKKKHEMELKEKPIERTNYSAIVEDFPKNSMKMSSRWG